MNGAVFFLAVNFLVALSSAAVFAVVATRSRSRAAALWLAAGFGVASLSAICELIVAYTQVRQVAALGAFASVLVGMVLLRAGIGGLYGRPLHKLVAAAFVAASIVVSVMIYGLPRGTLLQAFSYQTPFAVVMLSSALAVMASPRKLMIDRFLGALLLLIGLHFFAKAALAVIVGAGATAGDYVHTDYALVSQSATAFLMVALGLTLLAVLVLEIMADQRSESEKDALSGLANRRGFERQVEAILAETAEAKHAVILCDLDHFKIINDTYGHHVGDLVIQSFGRLLGRYAPNGAAVGRIGGEEFAILLPATDIDVALMFAQTLRGAVTAVSDLPEGVKVSASFGVAPLSSANELPDAYRRADIALYEAKNAGRNRVKLARNFSPVADART
jgi:diguanylate cyclase (GGDEF)-like protein